MRWRFVGLLAVLVGGCATDGGVRADLAVTDVWVHDGTGADPVRSNVFVTAGRFASAGRRTDAQRTVDGRGLHLVPGLIDMHVHVAAVERKSLAGSRFVDRGVTTVRDLGGFANELRTAAVSLSGPRIRSSITTLNGQAMAPFHRPVASEADTRRAVADLAQAGAVIVKVHRGFPRALLAPLVETARERSLGVTGHIPLGLHPLQACELGMSGIEHVGSLVEAYVSVNFGASQDDAVRYLLSPQSDPLYRCFVERGVMVTPTLVLYESIARSRSGAGPLSPQFRQFIAKMQAITFRLERAGVRLLAGSDASGLDRPAVAPGESLLRELELLRQSGLSGAAVMRIAAENPARALGIAADGRLIASGLPADFLLLRSDPRIDDSSYRAPVAIYFGGAPVSR